MDLCTPIFYKKFEVAYNPTLKSIFTDTSSNSYQNYFQYQHHIQLYVFRYAQTLLTYAEAKARSGMLDGSAYNAVNMVRRRAHKADIYAASIYDLKQGLSANAFADSVVWERAWELCAEPEGRWFDLMRLEMVEKLPQLRDPVDKLDYPKQITKTFYFRSIPTSETELNPNL